MLKPFARPSLSALDVIELLELDEARFKQRFADTPLLRSKRRGLLRNACVVLGNLGDACALPALDRARQDPEPLVAEHAAWAIGRIEQRRSTAH